MQDRLVFLIGSPHSGSTMLSRMLGAHPAIVAPEEPHLITPIAHLGYFESVERAPYDPVITRTAARALVAALPGGEAAYLDALRAYTDAIYAGLRRAAGGDDASLLLDKTPAYALSLDFLARLYPQARYVVLTRHPMAVWSSYVDSFFDGDDAVAHEHNPLLERYVPAIARFLRTRPVPIHAIRYEALVREPERHARELCAFLGIEESAGMVDYGEAPDARGESTRGLGDPTNVSRETRPTTASLSKWARAATGRPERVALYRAILARLADEDLETWGFERAGIAAELDAIDLGGRRAPRPPLTRYALERRLLVAVRRRIRPDNALGRLVRKLREVCDVLLR
ncbi:MAG: sulfotransferase [Myxococcota bacterium]